MMVLTQKVIWRKSMNAMGRFWARSSRTRITPLGQTFGQFLADPVDEQVNVPLVPCRIEGVRRGQDLVENIVQLLRGSDEGLEAFPEGIVCVAPAEQCPGKAPDGHEGVPDGVGDGRGDLSHEGQLFHPDNLLLLLEELFIDFLEPFDLFLELFMERGPFDGKGHGKAEGLQRFQIMGGDRLAGHIVVGKDDPHRPVPGDQRHDEIAVNPEDLRESVVLLIGMDPVCPPGADCESGVPG